MAKNRPVELEGVSLEHLAKHILSTRSECYITSICNKLSDEGIVEGNDLLRTCVESLETKLSTHSSFSFGEMADILTLRKEIEEIFAYSDSRSCKVRTTTSRSSQSSRSRSRRRDVRHQVNSRSRSRKRDVRHQVNPCGRYHDSSPRNPRQTRGLRSFGNQGKSSGQQKNPNPNHNRSRHDDPQKCKPALWEAVENNKIDQVSKLINKGCNVDEKWNNWSPLMKAAEEGYLEILNLLIDSGANLSATNRHGRDALSFAAAPSRNLKTPTNTLQRLIQCGANLNHVDDKGRTAREWAIREKRNDAIACFEEIGARPQ